MPPSTTTTISAAALAVVVAAIATQSGIDSEALADTLQKLTESVDEGGALTADDRRVLGVVVTGVRAVKLSRKRG